MGRVHGEHSYFDFEELEELLLNFPLVSPALRRLPTSMMSVAAWWHLQVATMYGAMLFLNVLSAKPFEVRSKLATETTETSCV